MKLKKLFARKNNNRRQPRANSFVLESLEPRLLLSAAPMTAAVVTTDHLDYAPGETAIITTSNQNGDGPQFAAGELVRFGVSRTDGMADAAGSTAGVGPAGNEAWYVTDGVGGFAAHLGADVSGDGVADWIAPDNDLTVNSSISTTWFVEEQYRNSSLLVTAQGLESGAVATQAFTDAATNTSTVLTATASTTVYGTRLDFTATVTAANAALGAADPTGSVEFFADGVSLGVETLSSGGAADGVVQFKTNLFTFQLTAGVHSVHAVFTGTPGSFNNSTSASISHTVTQKHITGRFIADLSKVYDGTTVAPGTPTLNNVELIDLGNVSLVGTANFDTANVGIKKPVTFTITGNGLTGSAAGNYILDSVRNDVADITPATVTVSDFTGVYDGLAHKATIVGAPGEDLSGSLNMVAQTNVGTFTESWTFANANYIAASGTNTITITKANATIGATGFNGVYDGAAHTASLTATGVLGESLSGLVLNATPHTIVGNYLDGWTFTDVTGNYNNASGTVGSSITALGITGNFTAADRVYDATNSAAVLTRTLAGVIGLDDVSLIGGTAAFNNANAGAGKTVTLTGATLSGAAAGNYSLLSVNTTTADITAKGITGNFTAANKVYDATTAATVLTRTLTGVIGLDDVSLTGGTAAFNNANAGTGKTVTLTGATLSGAAISNYSLTSVNATTANITKANATITVTGYNVVYDGAAHTATATATGVLGESLSGLNLSGTTHTNVGTGVYGDTVTFTDVTGNYNNATRFVTDRISKANVTMTVTGYNVVYNGLAHTATATATGVVGEDLSAGLNLSGTTHTNVGTGVYLDAVTYTDTTGNYRNATKFVKDYISKANATITVTGYNVVYDGLAHTATATATGVLGESLSGLDLSGTTHTNVGTGVYSDTVTFTDVTGNYKNGTKLVTDRISKANVTMTVTGYNVVYNGLAHTATATATGVVGEDLSAGLNLSGTTHTNVGTGVYLDAVTYTDTTGNYWNATKFVKDYISKANATITVTGYNVVYDGLAHTATATATGVLGESLSGLDLSGTTHTNVGTGVYSDTVTFTDVTGNYKNATKLVTDRISKANITFTVTGYAVRFDGLAHTATATATGVNGEDLSAGVNLSGTTHTVRGTYTDQVTYIDQTGNYTNATKFVKNFIV